MVKESGVTNDQYKIYKLIWERFIASQMSNCLMDTVSVDIDANGCGFKSTGYSVKFDGFTVLYEETKDDDGEKKNVLPPIKKGDVLKVRSLEGNSATLPSRLRGIPKLRLSRRLRKQDRTSLDLCSYYYHDTRKKLR